MIFWKSRGILRKIILFECELWIVEIATSHILDYNDQNSNFTCGIQKIRIYMHMRYWSQQGNIGPEFMNVSIIFVNVFSVTAVRVGAEIAPCAFQAITVIVCPHQRICQCSWLQHEVSISIHNLLRLKWIVKAQGLRITF